jgi:general L-amino acid transport system substrate-binding protein
MKAYARLTLRLCISALVGCFAFSWKPAAAQTLKAVKERGTLTCGVGLGVAGFSLETAAGWTGFDVDFCRALAVAVLGDADKVRYVRLNTEDRFPALQSGKIDVLSRNSTWTMSREVELKLVFPATTYFDGQGFLVHRARNVTSALELGGAKVCVKVNTTTETNLDEFFRANDMSLEHVGFLDSNEATKAYDADRCEVLTSDVSQLYADRLTLKAPDEHVILPDIISKEPLGPVVRQGDDQWFNIVKWTAFALVNAEELGITSNSIDEALRSEKPDVKRFLGLEGNIGEHAGLTRDWAARVIRSVGNYAEIFDRNVGDGSNLGIPRGLNELWNNGGILYAPPIR